MRPVPSPAAVDRLELAKKRLQSVLASHTIAPWRTLEQKIADAGPLNQRIEPHVLTQARSELTEAGILDGVNPENRGYWYFLASCPKKARDTRFAELEPIHTALGESAFKLRMGQTLEIAVFRGLLQQEMTFCGAYLDLEAHDDSKLYKKEEPPSSLSGKIIPKGIFDFLLFSKEAGPLGLEVKNVREWLYPDRAEIKDMLAKCCAIDAVPVLIARRMPFITSRLLTAAGVIVHQTFNQRFPEADAKLAALAAHKKKLGYHDIRCGNKPDARLLTFLKKNLPKIAPGARERFAKFRDLLSAYGTKEIEYPAFARRVKERAHLVD